jgi:uncharacterized RDD family membrane protein YckC
MAWYYKDGDQEIGPVGKDELQELINTGRIDRKTLARGDTMSEWRPLEELVRGASGGRSSQPPPMPEPPGKNAGPSADAAETMPALAVCSQCGRSFPRDQVVMFDERMICAACKPLFVQRLKEGAGLPGGLHYAGFWIRFGAKFIDGMIMAVVQWGILIPVGMLFYTTAQGNPQREAVAAGAFFLIGLQQLIAIGIPAVYNTYFLGRFGATPGKMACRLKVVTPEGGKVSYMRALGRNFAEWLSAIVFAIGYIMAGFDSEKRALHDRVCSTRVVYR